MTSERVQRRIDRLLDQVDESIDQPDWETVLARSQAVLALDPDNADAVNFLASAERALGNAARTANRDSKPASRSASASSQLTSFADGRYQVKRILGDGDKKKVYLAHDSTLDRDVGFALIKPKGIGSPSLTRIQREAQAMGRLSAHPHIVPSST